MNSDRFILLNGHDVVPCDDLLAWAAWFKGADRIVAQVTLPSGVFISTVFLGLDHNFGDGPPLVFETMIFGGKYDEYQRRYATWDEAARGHMTAFDLATRQGWWWDLVTLLTPVWSRFARSWKRRSIFWQRSR